MLCIAKSALVNFIVRATILLRCVSDMFSFNIANDRPNTVYCFICLKS